jgi:hypothetical protein
VPGCLAPGLVPSGCRWLHQPVVSTKQRGGMHAQAQQERRPPSAGASGQQAQRTFSDNRSAEAHDEANVKLKTAQASGTS